MPKHAPLKHLTDGYRFHGFTPKHAVTGIFGDPKARVITLVRRTKKASAELAEQPPIPSMTARVGAYAISRQPTPVSISILKYGASTAVLAAL